MMYRPDLAHRCAITPVSTSLTLSGDLLSRHDANGKTYLILSSLDSSEGNAEKVSCTIAYKDITHAIEFSDSAQVELPTSAVNDSLPAAEPFEVFLTHSLALFHRDTSIQFNQTITRLKQKKVGANALIDIENVSLAIVDYHRFLYQLKSASQAVPGDLSPLADRVIKASEIISNLQGGISILAGFGVEMHVQFALWLKKMEALRC